MRTFANILLFQLQKAGFILQAAGLRTFRMNFKRRIGTREYKINNEGLVVLKCTLEPNSRTLRTEPCPFCNAKYHIHGLEAGHKVGHCMRNIVITLPDGSTVSNFRGYFLERVETLENTKHRKVKILA